MKLVLTLIMVLSLNGFAGAQYIKLLGEEESKPTAESAAPVSVVPALGAAPETPSSAAPAVAPASETSKSPAVVVKKKKAAKKNVKKTASKPVEPAAEVKPAQPVELKVAAAEPTEILKAENKPVQTVDAKRTETAASVVKPVKVAEAAPKTTKTAEVKPAAIKKIEAKSAEAKVSTKNTPAAEVKGPAVTPQTVAAEASGAKPVEAPKAGPKSTKAAEVKPAEVKKADTKPAETKIETKTVPAAAVKKSEVKPAPVKKAEVTPVPENAVVIRSDEAEPKTDLPAPAPAASKDGGFVVDKKHAVVKGETLWGLAQKYYGDSFKWGKIYNANAAAVKNPDLIYPASELEIPDISEEIKPAATSETVSAQPEAALEPENGAVVADLNAMESDASPASAAEAVPSASAATALPIPQAARISDDKNKEPMTDFDVTDLSEEMPEDQKEWQNDVKIVPDNWREDGVITAKDRADDEVEGLSFTGETVRVRVSGTAALKPGDILKVYLKGADAFDKQGKRLGREMQKTGMIQVINISGRTVKAKIIEANTSVHKGQVVKK